MNKIIQAILILFVGIGSMIPLKLFCVGTIMFAYYIDIRFCLWLEIFWIVLLLLGWRFDWYKKYVEFILSKVKLINQKGNQMRIIIVWGRHEKMLNEILPKEYLKELKKKI